MSGRNGRLRRLLEGLSVPIGKLSPCLIRGLTKIEQSCAGRRGAAHVVIHKDKFIELRVVKGGRRIDASFAETGWFRNHVGIKGRSFDAAAGPKSDTANFVRISVACEGI